MALLSHQQRRNHTQGPASERPRRQAAQPIPTTARWKPRPHQRSTNPQVKANPPGRDLERSKKLLEPYVLSRRLTDLVTQDRLDEAVDMLQNSPLDSSNVKTWNTLLRHCMMKKRFKLGYKLFTDVCVPFLRPGLGEFNSRCLVYLQMKRRGFKPNVRTYEVLLNGLSRIENWEEHTNQFKNAQALWRGFLQLIEQLKQTNPKHKEITSNPAAFYIFILSANKEYNALFDVLNDLDEEGPFAPSEFIYTKIFQAITYRTQLTPGDKEKVAYRNASDAKLLWKDLTKRAVKNPTLISNHIVLYFLKALMKGRPADQLYAFDFVRDYLGLSKPGEEAPPRRIELTSMTLDAVLLLCLTSHKYRLCIHYVQQLIDEAIASGGECVVDFRHLDRVLASYASMTMAGSVGESDRAVETIEWMHQYRALGWNVQPQASTYGWGLMACWRGGDWASAARIAELMTGCHAEDFVDDSPNMTSPRLDDRSEGLRYVPDVRDMSCLLRAASASGEVTNMRQCLRMATFFGGLRASNSTKSMDAYLDQDMSTKDLANTPATVRGGSFYLAKVASALADVLKRVLEGTDPATDTPEMKAWRGLKAEARKILRESAKPDVETPGSELQPLGSAEGLEATERFVDFDLAKRSQKFAKITR